MRVVPVLDLKNGCAVHAVAGRRSEYRIVQSVHGSGQAPVLLAQALMRSINTHDLYVADLDAILERGNNDQTVRALAAAGARVWLDRGIRSEDDLSRALATGAHALILALETAPPAKVVARWLRSGRRLPPVILSIDMLDGRLVADDFSQTGDVDEVVKQAVALGICRILLLDLQSVGRASGPTVLEFGRRIRRLWPELWICGGGGVRNVDDLLAAQRAGFDAYLVATALHTGKVDRHSLEYLRRIRDRAPHDRTDSPI